MTPKGGFREEFQAAVVAPLRAFRWSYLPPMMVYFAAGCMALTAVASQFWVRKELSLSPAALAGLAVWAGLPAVMKMVFGEMVDTVRILGSNRRIYIFIGAGMVATALLLLSGAASGRLTFASPNTIYIIAVLLSAIGVVMQDVAADAMTTEVVPRAHADGSPREQAAIDADLTMVQVLGRLFLLTGGLIVAYLGGVLAKYLPYSTVFLIGLIVPAISITGALLVKTDSVETRPTDWVILGGGIGFGAGVLLIGLLGLPFGQELTFLISLSVIVFMLHRISGDMEPIARKRIFYAALIIFFFRAFPSVGEGYNWFLMDTYGFDEVFFGTVDTVGSLLTLLMAWALAGVISRAKITSVLLWLTIVATVLALPALLLIFPGPMLAFSAATGISPRLFTIVNSAVQSPIFQLSMIPMLALIAINAPAKSRAIWFALMASFMNLALTAGDLMTKYMNQLFVIERGQYAALPPLVIWCLVISTILPIAAVMRWRRHVD